MHKHIITVPLQGGKVNPNPQFQDALKQVGLDPGKVLQEVQDEVKKYKYPIQKVELEVAQGTYVVKIHTPPVGDLLLKLLGRDTGARSSRDETIGNISLRQLVEIAELKRDELKSKTLKAAVKQLVSTCKAMGIAIDGKPAGEVLKEIDMGKYDEYFKP